MLINDKDSPSDLVFGWKYGSCVIPDVVRDHALCLRHWTGTLNISPSDPGPQYDSGEVAFIFPVGAMGK